MEIPVWVANQPEGGGYDFTTLYLKNAGIAFELREDGVPLVDDFDTAALAVFKGGHNDEDFDREYGLPNLIVRED